MASMESMFKERMGNMESEVSQLREAISLSAEGSVPKSKTDEDPPKTKTVQAPAKKKVNQAQAPAKKKLHDEEIDRAGEDSPDAALVYLREEDWEKVSTWLAKSKTKWLHNLEIDAMMYVFRERTSLKRWELHRVAFMSAVFSNMIKKEYESFKAGIRKYKLHHLLLQYGKGVLPPHGRTQEIWNVDVDWLYVPVHVSGNHWISLCISVVTRSIDVFDCSGRKRYKEVDAFANLVPRIVKAVQPPRCHKDFNVAAYTVHYVPMVVRGE
ncbi:PREDICTED: uncharacterized protein LOC106299961 isoform X3 [Brassica oleracea var. oleracea]|uniref:uncharacterized protein LOC106299961 isoform X3 n=1 Tax=Brassica oleracea var. oleracea TaxID=109376 RepID=UPI0006A6A131|nr:PREDICTED: uncharacterized protein LOC106299961 isoform X3 [Brassica oleracea var. oleracea]